jgi:predicted small secreted protein
MFRKTLTLQALAATLLLGSATFTSCNQAQKQEMSAESEQAYNDFKTFVADTEAKTEAVASEAEADYDRETAQLKSDFDAKVAAVDRYADQYDDARRQEIEQLRTRYTTAYDKREMTWRNRPGATAAMNGSTGTMKMGKYYKPSSPAARLTAANARQTYEAFVNDIKQNEDRYDIDDWRNINAEWRALDEAYDKVKKDIPAGDLAEIQKEKLKYAAFKSYDKAEARAAQGADATERGAEKVADETQDERSAVGRAAENTAKDVKNAGKKVGGAVKDVFDGKDDKNN